MFEVKTELKPFAFCGRPAWAWKADFIGLGDENASRLDRTFTIQGMTCDLEMAQAELTDLVNLVTIRLERLGFKEVKC